MTVNNASVRPNITSGRTVPEPPLPSIIVRPGNLLEILAHELRTPMTTLIGASALLDRPAVPGRLRRHLVRSLTEESERLARFLDDFLALADASAGNVRLEPVLVQRLVRQVVRETGPSGALARVTIQAEPDVPPAEADSGALRHVLSNLLRHATLVANDSPVEVAVSRAGERVVIKVSGRTTRAGPRGDAEAIEPGARLWLMSARALIAAMHGRFRASDTADGRLVRISLPIAHPGR